MKSHHQGGLILVCREAHDLPGVSNFVLSVFYATLHADALGCEGAASFLDLLLQF